MRGELLKSRTGLVRPYRARHEPGRMNSLEKQFRDEIVHPGIMSGNIISAHFEGMKLRIGEKCFYTPDWLLVWSDHIELAECKGHWEDDARVKIKAVADKFPCFKFTAWQRKKGVWSMEDF